MPNGNTKLTIVDAPGTCIACFENTLNRVSCCGAEICEGCYYKWLQTKRQCMHCKEDQCDFDVWVNEYRVEPEFDPQEYLHDLLQEGNDVLGDTPMPTHAVGFGIENLLNVIQHNLQEATGNPPILLPPGDLLPPTVPFELQFGFTMTPTDLQGNPTGPGVTVTQSMDYPGPSDNAAVYNQIQEHMQQYQQLFGQYDGNPQPPLIPYDDGDSPPNLEWPWDSGPSNYNQ